MTRNIVRGSLPRLTLKHVLVPTQLKGKPTNPIHFFYRIESWENAESFKKYHLQLDLDPQALILTVFFSVIPLRLCTLVHRCPPPPACFHSFRLAFFLSDLLLVWPFFCLAFFLSSLLFPVWPFSCLPYLFPNCPFSCLAFFLSSLPSFMPTFAFMPFSMPYFWSSMSSFLFFSISFFFHLFHHAIFPFLLPDILPALSIPSSNPPPRYSLCPSPCSSSSLFLPSFLFLSVLKISILFFVPSFPPFVPSFQSFRKPFFFPFSGFSTPFFPYLL